MKTKQKLYKSILNNVTMILFSIGTILLYSLIYYNYKISEDLRKEKNSIFLNNKINFKTVYERGYLDCVKYLEKNKYKNTGSTYKFHTKQLESYIDSTYNEIEKSIIK